MMARKKTGQQASSTRAMMKQVALQQQIIDLQAQVIALQQQIDAMTPKNPPDSEVIWHIASGGMKSQEAAESTDAAVVRRFLKWNQEMAVKHIKPYVNPKVFMECLNQMTRGLPSRVAELETRDAFRELKQQQEAAARN